MKDIYYEKIKDLLIDNEIYKRVKEYSTNKKDLETKYNIGKELSEAGKHYGEGIIKKYSIQLTCELGKGYSVRSLKYMRNFYYLQKGQPVAAELTWSHYIELLPLKNINEINYYINLCIKLKLSRNDLRKRIQSKEYERLPESTKNKLMVENISEFIEQLGEGYSFIKSEYKIKIGNIYNYIDLLLFNIKFNCYVVVELKVTELKKEHIGQIQVYMNYIDQNIKTIYQNATIGIILVKRNNEFIIEYSSDTRIISRKYEII